LDYAAELATSVPIDVVWTQLAQLGRGTGGRETIKVGADEVIVDFHLRLETVDPARFVARVELDGDELLGGGTIVGRGDVQLRPVEAGTSVDIRASLELTGPLVQLGPSAGPLLSLLIQDRLDRLADTRPSGSAPAPAPCVDRRIRAGAVVGSVVLALGVASAFALRRRR
jgi:hypothetical protein